MNFSPFEPAHVLADETGASVRPYWTQDFGREKRTEGHSVLVPETSAKMLLLKVRRRLPAGYVAFVGTTHNLDTPSPGKVELVLARGSDQFDIIRLAATDGINYGLTTENIIHRLIKWDQQFGIDIWQASTDTIQMDLNTSPADTQELAQELQAFCPDSYPEITGNELENQRAIYLWWD